MIVAEARSPRSYSELAGALADAAANRSAARICGSGTKAAWGYGAASSGAPDGASLPEVRLATSALDAIVEHNVGDLTAVLQAGVRLADAQARFAAEEQMLALDPPLGQGDAATLGGVFATGDSGPLRHRYGAPRDLVLGMTVALTDGTVARSGGKVIKNVAGYDLAKLFTGSFGTLGAIVEVVVRLHPLPRATATLVARSDVPGVLARAARTLAHAPLELEALDVSWADGRGAVAARFAGATARERAARSGRLLRPESVGLDLVEDEASEWERQRSAQRSPAGVVVRVAGLPAQLERVLSTAAGLGASAVGRAALGLSWIRLPAAAAADAAAGVAALRRELAPMPCVVLDAPPDVRERVDVWDVRDAPLLALTRRVKERFDPADVCNRGAYLV